MKLIGRYASTTNRVRFENEEEIELLFEESTEEAIEYTNITEVVYLDNVRFVIEDKITYEEGFVLFATCYDTYYAEKRELQLTSDWDAKEYTYTITVYSMN